VTHKAYENLKSRVEKYFDVALHVFVSARSGLKTCQVCFLPEDHPVHEDNEE